MGVEKRQDGGSATARPAVRLPVLLKNLSPSVAPQDPGPRRAAEWLCDGSPMVKTGHACNLECTYCCNKAVGPALQPPEVLRATVDGLRDLGYTGIGYMGGEPLIHAGFLDLVRHAASRGFDYQLIATNGVRLAEGDLAERLFEAGINSVTVSLDTFDEEVQESLYGGRALYRKAMIGLDKALAAPGVDMLVSTVVTALNAAHLPRYMEEVARRQDLHGKPIGVMVCLLQQPFRDGEAQRALPMPLLESAAVTKAALARARDLGVPAITFGYPPCVLDGFEQNVSELYAIEWVIDVGTGVLERSRLGDSSVFWPACATCPHAGFCRGVLRQYASDEVRAHVADRARRDAARRGDRP
jgi:pyruvate-formate lyase-activating enzyme